MWGGRSLAIVGANGAEEHPLGLVAGLSMPDEAGLSERRVAALLNWVWSWTSWSRNVRLNAATRDEPASYCRTVR
jgi:hypothetical protein